MGDGLFAGEGFPVACPAAGELVMMGIMRRWIALFVVVLTVALAPLSAMAADENAPKSYDGRLDDYAQPVTLDGGGTALTYFLFVGLGFICLGAMFKNARRSHLD